MKTHLKYFLKELLPKNYIDIHNHILPDIDDGVWTAGETNYIIAQMKSINISTAIATPHVNSLWNNNKKNIKEAYKNATQIVSNKSFLQGYACEYMLDSGLLKKSNEEKLVVLPDNYLLIELNLFCCPMYLFEMLFELKNNNYKIILAHPERYCYLNCLIEYVKIKEYGIFFQLNLLSLTGYYGKKTQHKAIELLENNLYDFTGTDIHNSNEIDQFKNVPLLVNSKKSIDNLLQKNSIFIRK